MAGSTSPEAKRRILALLAAWPALAGIQATWAPPGETEEIPKSGEMIYLADVDLTAAWKTLGTGQREEDYTVGLGVFVQQDGTVYQAAEERSWDLLAEIASALASDKFLGGLLNAGHAAEITTARQRVGAGGPDTTASRIDAEIRCVARFTP